MCIKKQEQFILKKIRTEGVSHSNLKMHVNSNAKPCLVLLKFVQNIIATIAESNDVG